MVHGRGAAQTQNPIPWGMGVLRLKGDPDAKVKTSFASFASTGRKS